MHLSMDACDVLMHDRQSALKKEQNSSEALAK